MEIFGRQHFAYRFGSWLIFCIFLMSFCASAAEATVAYSYVGNNITEWTPTGKTGYVPGVCGGGGFYTDIYEATGSLAPLTGSATFDIPAFYTGSAAPISGSLAVAGVTDTNSNSSVTGTFQFNNGNITQWNFNASNQNHPTNYFRTANNGLIVGGPCNGQISGGDSVDFECESSNNNGICTNLCNPLWYCNNATPGKWTINGETLPPPVAANEDTSTDHNTALTIDLSANNTGGAASSAALRGLVTGGTVTGFPSTKITFKPAKGFKGTANFQYTLSNAGGTSNTANVLIAVSPINISLHLVDPFLLAPNSLGNIDLTGVLPPKSWLSVKANGLEADNTSAAIAVLSTDDGSDSVTFTSNNGTSILQYDSNFLASLPNYSGSQSVTVQASSFIQIGKLFYAAVLLQAPATSVTFNYSFPISIVATQDSIQDTASIYFASPPVLLLHGLWANSSSMKSIATYLQQNSSWSHELRVIKNINYPNNISFDSNENVAKISAAISNIENELNNKLHIVGGRIDVVAHSMGGLVVRSYAGQPSTSCPSAYNTLHDRCQGQFHQVITVDTPEDGSALASYLISHLYSKYNNQTDNASAGVWLLAGCHKSDDVEKCFQRIEKPIASDGQSATTGAVYSLIPGGQSLVNTPGPRINNAIWRAISAVRPQGSTTTTESTLQWAIEHLIGAIWPASEAPTIAGILDSVDSAGVAEDDVIVPLSSQLAAKSGYPEAQPGEFLTFDGLDHSSVLTNTGVDNAIGCWLYDNGSSPTCVQSSSALVKTGAIKADAVTVTPVTVAPTNGPLRTDDQLVVSLPSNLMLAKTYTLKITVPTGQLSGIAIHQVDRNGQGAPEQMALVKKVDANDAIIQITPLLLGSVQFTIQATYSDNQAIFQNIETNVATPNFAPKKFSGDVDLNEITLKLDPRLKSLQLMPRAYFAVEPDYPVDVSDVAQYRISSISPDPVIELSSTGLITALRPGHATVEVQFGSTIDTLKINVIRIGDN